mgnify:CR=1 FL=1|jgi:hypothetical protein
MGIVGLGPGIYLGMLHQCKLWKGLTMYEYPRTWYVAKGVGRLAVGALVAGPFALLFLLTPEQIPEIWLLAMVACLIPATIAGYTWFGMSDHLSFKLGLYDKRDPGEHLYIVNSS